MNVRIRLLVPAILTAGMALGCNQNKVPPKTAVAQNMDDTKRTIDEAVGNTNQNIEQNTQDTKDTVNKSSDEAQKNRQQSAEDTQKTIEGDQDEK